MVGMVIVVGHVVVVVVAFDSWNEKNVGLVREKRQRNRVMVRVGRRGRK